MHKCTHCNYSSLRLLENAFENKQPNKCNQCSYASSPAGHLKTHLQTHSSEKPKKCNQRSYASSRESNLRSHMKRRTNQVSLWITVISLMLLTKFMSTNSNKMFICSKLNYFQRFIFDGLPKFSNDVCKSQIFQQFKSQILQQCKSQIFQRCKSQIFRPYESPIFQQCKSQIFQRCKA